MAHNGDRFQDKTARIWDAHTGQRRTKRWLTRTKSMRVIRFIQSRWAVCRHRRRQCAQIWDALTGELATPALKHAGSVHSVRFNPDGNLLVTACSDGTARIWDVGSGQPLSEPLRHGGQVGYAEFSPDGRFVVTASSDGTARVWEVWLAPCLCRTGCPTWQKLSPVKASTVGTSTTWWRWTNSSPSGWDSVGFPRSRPLPRWHRNVRRVAKKADAEPAVVVAGAATSAS